MEDSLEEADVHKGLRCQKKKNYLAYQ